jgi:hypothetical protein
VLVFPDGGIPEEDSREGQMAALLGNRGPQPEDLPAEFRGWLGNVTAEETIPQHRRFAEEGGALVAFGGSAALGHYLGLPVSDHLVELQANGEARRLPQTKYYIPGSILRVAVDNTNPLAFGLHSQVDVMFDNSPLLHLAPNAVMAGAKPVAWFDSKTPLRSGWAWGQHFLEGGVAVAEASLGKGKVFLFGPEITFRAQPHGTFKFLFNTIYYGTAQRVGASTRETTAQGQEE